MTSLRKSLPVVFTQENGKIYINHPYIITVRKLVNAYCAKNISVLCLNFIPRMLFLATQHMKWGVSMDLAARKKGLGRGVC